MFLRQEIERVKYSKDKDSYGRFMSGLMKNRGASSTKLNTSFEEPALKEITIANVNKSDKKRVEFVVEVAPQKSEKK